MPQQLRVWIEAAIDRLPKHPLIRLCGLLLAAFAAIVGAAKGYKELFPVYKPPPPSPVFDVKVVVPPPVVPTIPAPEIVPSISYDELWAQCIPPAQRSGVTNFKSTKPSGYQLDDSLVFWSGHEGALAENCIASLLKAGASPDATLQTANSGYGMGSALHNALSRKRWRNVQVLLEAGANPNARTVYRSSGVFPTGEAALDVAIASGAAPDIIAAITARGGISAYRPVGKSSGAR